MSVWIYTYLISQWKHTQWVLIRSASVRNFEWVPIMYLWQKMSISIGRKRDFTLSYSNFFLLSSVMTYSWNALWQQGMHWPHVGIYAYDKVCFLKTRPWTDLAISTVIEAIVCENKHLQVHVQNKHFPCTKPIQHFTAVGIFFFLHACLHETHTVGTNSLGLHTLSGLTLVLLNQDIPCLCKQCKSRMISWLLNSSGSALFAIMWTFNNPDQEIWHACFCETHCGH